MHLKLTHNQAESIYNSIDFDGSGEISFPELISDFERTVKTDLDVLLREERERAAETIGRPGMDKRVP
jgi:Ca2+-binding EF-hand superfamily protein